MSNMFVGDPLPEPSKPPVFEPGIYEIPNEVYHASNGISRSGLTYIARSPAHYYEEYLSGNREEKTSKALAIGEMIHNAVLEPELFFKKYKVLPDGWSQENKNSKKYKEGLEQWMIENPGVIPISDADNIMITAMLNKLSSHPLIRKGLCKGKAEQSIYWKDKETGVLLKCRPDFLRNDGVVIDVKTSDDASPKEFSKSIFNYDYHVQAAMTLDGVSAHFGIDAKDFIIMAIEKARPYCCPLYRIDDAAIEKGREYYMRYVRIYAECLASGKWPEYSENIETISLPPWAWSS